MVLIKLRSDVILAMFTKNNEEEMEEKKAFLGDFIDLPKHKKEVKKFSINRAAISIGVTSPHLYNSLSGQHRMSINLATKLSNLFENKISPEEIKEYCDQVFEEFHKRD